MHVCAASHYISQIFREQEFRKLSQIHYRTYQKNSGDGWSLFVNTDLIDAHESTEFYRLMVGRESFSKIKIDRFFYDENNTLRLGYHWLLPAGWMDGWRMELADMLTATNHSSMTS